MQDPGVVMPGFSVDYSRPPPLPDGIVVSNVPPELNTLDSLNRHFRRFGEVLKIVMQTAEGTAFVQFSDRAAAEAAVNTQVFDRNDIIIAWAPRIKGAAKGRGRASGPAENRVLVSNKEAHQKLEESKKRNEEITQRRNQLLGNLTEQMKTIMSKLQEKDIDDAKREAYQKLQLKIREKMDAVLRMGNPKWGQEEALTWGGKPGADAPPKGASKGPRTSRWNLDLRSRVLRVIPSVGWTPDRVRDDLRTLGPFDEHIVDVRPDVEHGDPAVLVTFRERRHAEAVFNQRQSLAPATAIDWSNAPPAPEPIDVDGLPPEVGEGTLPEVPKVESGENGDKPLLAKEELPPTATDAAPVVDSAAVTKTEAPAVARPAEGADYRVDLSEEEEAQ